MKKTLLIAQIFPPSVGGVENYLRSICSCVPHDKLIVLAHDDQKHSQEQNDFDEHQAYKIYRVNFFNNTFGPRWLQAYKKAKGIIAQQGIEHIFCGEILPTGTIALLLRKPFSVFTYGRDMILPQQFLRKKVLAKYILKKAKSIFTISRYTKDLINTYGAFSDKIIMLPPGVDHHFFAPDKINQNLYSKHHLQGKKILLSIGRLDPRKGFDTVISAMPKVIQHVPNAHYLIIGKGDQKEDLKRLVAQFHLEQAVTIVEDFVPDADLPNYYAICDAFIMVSKTLQKTANVEGFGIVYIEANASGKPVIAGNTGGTSDAVINGETGFLVDPEDTTEISDKIITLLTHPEIARTFGQKGRQRAIQEFDWDKKIKKIKYFQ